MTVQTHRSCLCGHKESDPQQQWHYHHHQEGNCWSQFSSCARGSNLRLLNQVNRGWSKISSNPWSWVTAQRLMLSISWDSADLQFSIARNRKTAQFMNFRLSALSLRVGLHMYTMRTVQIISPCRFNNVNQQCNILKLEIQTFNIWFKHRKPTI